MKVSRVYEEQQIEIGQHVKLSESVSHHLSKVLRAKQDQMLIVFTGDGHDYLGRIEIIHKREVTFFVEEKLKVENESPLNIHLAQCISKGDRMDYAIQKAVELGVKTITPIQSERNNVKLDKERMAKKQDHWQKVAISAAEQSGRAVITKIKPASNLNDFVSEAGDGLKLVLHHREANALSKISNPASEIYLVIGPEGGLSETEISNCKLQEFQPVSLGPRVLRTETAPLTAISVIQAMWGDLS